MRRKSRFRRLIVGYTAGRIGQNRRKQPPRTPPKQRVVFCHIPPWIFSPLWPPGTLTHMPCTCTCCCGACCEAGVCSVLLESECTEIGGVFKGKRTTCDPDPCGCVTDDDCCTTGYYFNNGGTLNGPYATALECSSASAAACSPIPCPCFCEAIDPYCCGGTCQSEPCDPP